MSEGGKSVQVLDPASGTVEQLAPDAAQAAFTQGTRQLLADDQVPLVGGDGRTLADFPTAKVQEALAQGWNFANRKDVLTADAQHQQVRAFAEAVASPLTFSASDLLMSQLGAEGIQERRDTAAGVGGEVLGNVAMLLGTSGLGSAAGETAAQAGKSIMARTMEAALKPTVALETAARGIEEAGAAALADLGASAGASKLAGAVLGNSSVGAGIGALQAVTEESLGDPSANAQSLLAAAGMGALIGGGLGGAVGAAGHGIGSLLGKSAKRAEVAALDAEQLSATLSAQGLEVAPDNGILAKFAKMVREDAPEALGYARKDLEAVNSPRGQAWIRDREKVLDTSARDFGSVLNQMAREQESAGQLVSKLKPEVLRELLVPGTAGSAVSLAGETLAAARQEFSALESALGRGGAYKKQLKVLDDAEESLFKSAGVPRGYEERLSQESAGQAFGSLGGATKTTVSAEAKQWSLQELGERFVLPDHVSAKTFETLDQVRQLMGRAPKGATPEVLEAFQRVEAKLASALEDKGTWGRAADFQRDMTAAATQRNEAWAEVQKHLRFGTDGVDGASVRSYMDRLSNVRGDSTRSAVERWQAANRTWSDAAEQFYHGRGIGDRARGLSDQFNRVGRDMSEKVSVFNSLTNLQRQEQAEQWGQGNVMGSVLQGGALGLASTLGLGGIVGAGLAAAGVQSITRPGTAALIRANVQPAMTKVGAAIKSLAARATGAARTAAEQVTPRSSERLVAASTRGILTAASSADRRKAFEARLKELHTLSDPATFHDNAQRVLGDAAGALPNHSAAMTATAQMALHLVMSKLPAARQGTGATAYGPKPAPSDAAVLKFAQADHAAQDPLGTLHGAVERGLLLTHEREVLEQVSPQILDAFRQELIANAEQGKVDTKTVRLLESVLGQQDHARIAAAQQVHAAGDQAGQQAAQSTGGGKPAPSVSVTIKSESDSLGT